MSGLWTQAEYAIAQSVASALDVGDYYMTWSAEIDSPFREETITVTGQVEDYDDGYVESVVSAFAASLDSTVTHVDGMAETSTVVDGVRVVIWGVADRAAFDALARRLDADRKIAKGMSRARS